MLSSLDGGRDWSVPEGVAQGYDPCISSDRIGTPWITYDSMGDLCCAVRRAAGGWRHCVVYSGVNVTAGPPSMVCSNYSVDVDPPPPPPCDMGYAVFVAYPNPGFEVLHRALLFVAFDTIHQDSKNNYAYNYLVQQLHEPGPDSSGEFDSMPCISRTPGGYLHVTWKMGEGSSGYDQVVYTTTTTDPYSIRDDSINGPVWTTPFLLSTDAQGSEPTNDAFADGVMALWQAESYSGVIDERDRNVNYPGWPHVPSQWSDIEDEAGNPTVSRTAGVWPEQFDPPSGNINSRFLDDQQPLRLFSSATDQICPQADVQVAEGQGGTDTMRLVWTESDNGWYAIKFALRLHQSGRDGYYQVVCGQDTPSPYCVQRDGAMALNGYSIDYSESTLVYRLRYLNPLYGYRIRAVAYQNTTGSIQQSFLVSKAGGSTEASTQAVVSPNTPTEVWLDIPPSLYPDGVVDFTVSKLQGEYAALAGLTLYEYEEGDSVRTGGGQSGKISPLLVPRELVLEQSWPNPATRNLTIRYGIPRLTTVSLKVYDVSGKVVRTLETNNLLKPGYYNINWNCRDNRDREVAGGVYFYRLVASDKLLSAGGKPGANVKTKKLVIAR